MVEIILLFGSMGIIGTGFILSALICYPFETNGNGETLKEYLKELF